MDFLSAIFYGIVQGITEFLPVSSSAHLAAIPHYLKIEDPGVYFDLMMHFGTALALVLYFRKRIWQLGRISLKATLGLIAPAASDLGNEGDQLLQRNLSLFRNFLFSSIVTVIVILLVKDISINYARNHTFIAINLIIFGILLFAVDFWAQKRFGLIATYEMESRFQFKKALLIGIAQAIAIFPGVSRSGITITTGRFLGLSREESSNYSFLLSIPIVLLAAGLKLAETLSIALVQEDTPTISPLVLLTALLVSFLVGLATIHYFLKLINKIPFIAFTLYRILLAILLLVS
ncbi:MAG: undecaprenyl-diphosphate phosphatase [Oligoflexia bacterium]|nr:undecaprenyl-diphosphate phosphatase [Oligoflexia bacterium]MBF0364882.1 undecaprenyl-diphosphate phosphatase [Oligoflexia bacterium]